MGQNVSIGESLFNEGKLEEAMTHFKAEYQKNESDKSKLAIHIALLYQLDGDLKGCEEYLDRSLSHNPTNGLAILHKAIIYFIKSTKEQVVSFSQFIDKHVKFPMISKSYLSHVGIAMCLHTLSVTYHSISPLPQYQAKYLSLAAEFFDNPSHPLIEYVRIVITSNSNDQIKEIQNASSQSTSITSSNYYKLWDERGKALYLAHSYKQALACFNICSALNVLSYEARLYCGLVLFDLGEIQKALTIFKYISDFLNPKCNEAWLHRGMICVELGRLNEAIYCYSKLLELDPTNSLAWERQASAILKRKGHNYATEALQSVSNAVHLSSRNINAMRLKGKCLMELEMYDDAMKVFNGIIEKKSNDYPTYRLKGDIYKIKGKYQDAAMHYVKVLERHYDDREVWCEYADCLLHLEKYEEGIIATDNALTITSEQSKNKSSESVEKPGEHLVSMIFEKFNYIDFPDNFHDDPEASKIQEEEHYKSVTTRIWMIRSILLWKSFNIDQAKFAIEEALKINPQLAKAWETKGHILCHYEQGAKEALDSFRKAFEYDSTNPLILRNIISISCLLENYTDALKDSEKLLSLTPDDAFANWMYGNILYLLGRNQEVLDFLIPKNLNDYQIHLLTINALRKLGEHRKELNYYNKLVTENPLNVKLQHERGRVCLQLKEYKEAYRSFRKAYKNKRNSFKCRADYYFSMLYLEKRKETGITNLKQLYESHKEKYIKWKEKLNEEEKEMLCNIIKD